MDWQNDSKRRKPNDPMEQSMLNNRLRDAVTNGEHPMQVRELIDRGAEVNPESRYQDSGNMLVTPLLHLAARMDRPTVIEVLAGADRDHLDVRDMYGRNALHVAALEGSNASSHVLLQMGLDPMAQDKLGFTAMDLAQARGNQEVVNIIRANCGDVPMRDDLEKLRSEVAAAYPQTSHSHVRKLREQRDNPPFPDIPIR